MFSDMGWRVQLDPFLPAINAASVTPWRQRVAVLSSMCSTGGMLLSAGIYP